MMLKKPYNYSNTIMNITVIPLIRYIISISDIYTEMKHFQDVIKIKWYCGLYLIIWIPTIHTNKWNQKGNNK